MELDRLLRERDGVVSARHAVAAGVPARTLRRWVATGRFSAPLPGVLLGPGHPFGVAARCRAAVLWAGPSAVLHGPSAAWWHRMLDAAPSTVTVTVARSVVRPPRPGIRVRRRDLAPDDRTEVRHLPVTARPLTVLETAIAVPDGAAFLDRALQRWITFEDLHAAWCRMCGATGAAPARTLLVAAGDRAASLAERRLVRLLRQAGVGGWVLGYVWGPYELDLAFPEHRVAVEVDGWAWHSDVERFRTDRRKGNDLASAGWTLLRVTWHDLDSAPGRVLAQVRHALRRAG